MGVRRVRVHRCDSPHALRSTYAAGAAVLLLFYVVGVPLALARELRVSPLCAVWRGAAAAMVRACGRAAPPPLIYASRISLGAGFGSVFPTRTTRGSFSEMHFLHLRHVTAPAGGLVRLGRRAAADGRLRRARAPRAPRVRAHVPVQAAPMRQMRRAYSSRDRVYARMHFVCGPSRDPRAIAICTCVSFCGAHSVYA